MHRHALLALPTLAALLLPATSGEGDRAPASPQEFAKLLTDAEKAFARHDYLHAAARLREGITIANGVLRETLLATMPAAPAGFVELESPTPHVDAADPLSATLSLAPNRPVERRYRAREGRGEVRVLIAPASPGADAARRAVALAENDPNSELLERGPRIGVLTRSRAGLTIRFVLGDQHLVEVRAFGADEAQLLERIDQDFLDRVARVLGA